MKQIYIKIVSICYLTPCSLIQLPTFLLPCSRYKVYSYSTLMKKVRDFFRNVANCIRLYGVTSSYSALQEFQTSFTLHESGF
jgi:hypothetical protein